MSIYVGVKLENRLSVHTHGQPRYYIPFAQLRWPMG